MKISKVTAVYFSPTAGTAQYVKAIAEELAADYGEINLTMPSVRTGEYNFGSDELVVFGAPVYAGRLPALQGGLFEKIHGQNTPAVFNVSYGNREFDDALLEMKDICEANGFKGIAAGAWLAQHTYTAKVAGGRPTAEDLADAKKFAQEVKELLSKPTAELKVPGNRPYRDAKAMPVHPEAGENCEQCGLCAEVCPTGAIDAANPKTAEGDLCLNCLACVKHCPRQARKIDHPMFREVQAKLEKNLAGLHKNPQTFLAE